VLRVAPAPRKPGQLVGDHRGLHIHRAGATLWIAQKGDPADYRPGAREQYTSTRPGPVALKGMEDW